MAERRSHGHELPITDHDHAQGAAAAPITLIEYGDYECPYSREAVKTVQVFSVNSAAIFASCFGIFLSPRSIRMPYRRRRPPKRPPRKERSGRCMRCCSRISGSLNTAI